MAEIHSSWERERKRANERENENEWKGKINSRENLHARHFPMYLWIFIYVKSGKKFNILTIKEMIVSYKRKFSKSHNSCKAFFVRGSRDTNRSKMKMENSESNGIKDSLWTKNKWGRFKFRLIINFVQDAQRRVHLRLKYA